MRLKRHNIENYVAIFDGRRTVRFAINPTKPILPLRYPEIEDISLGTLCDGGCPYCYASASQGGVTYADALLNLRSYYGGLSENDRPFQVAIGGGGEPTMHQDFPAILAAFRELGIVPNYTTNGQHLTDEVLAATAEYAGGVAVSCHAHLPWRDAFETLSGIVGTSLHIIVGETGSSDRFWEIYDSTDKVDYYVALPYRTSGRAPEVNVLEEWEEFFEEVLVRHPDNVSFGAAFYEYLLERPKLTSAIGVNMYEPEVLSGYRMLDDSYRLLRKSSYDLRPKFEE